MRRLGDKASRGSGHLGRLTNSRFILFPFPSLLFHAFSRDMALPCLALPYMSPRQLEGGVLFRLALKTMI
jgi:hypothetical protein